MDEPKSLDSLFKEKIFRIPDYQRGYAWQKTQLKAFWEDLINLDNVRSHYVGVLTLKEIPQNQISETDKEFWLVDDQSYRMYHIVDGQQRLTTFIIFLQSFVDFFKALTENKDKSEESIFVTENLSLVDLQSRYLFKIKPKDIGFRTYKFGYTDDNPSYEYLRFQIFGESGGGMQQETFYTLNLSNAKTYFTEQILELHRLEGLEGIQKIYKKLTKRFLFNEYVIIDDFNVFVAFETMNNRGKKLSDLELLKNRLIYLTTLYSDEEMGAASRKYLQDNINNAWKEIYHHLGRNKSHPLNDDDFLRAHWTMYFNYSRKTGRDYIHFLLNEKFTPQNVHRKVEKEVDLQEVEEQSSEADNLEIDDENVETSAEIRVIAYLQPKEISDYVNSLKESIVHWFNSFYPDLASNASSAERLWIHRLNRVGMAYFRPLVMSILKNERDESARIKVFQKIERFIFIAFRTTSARSNYKSSEFYNAARQIDRKEISLDDISQKLDSALSFAFNSDGTLRKDEFYNILYRKFENGSGYYSWSGLLYFLYEYELYLLSQAIEQKVYWTNLLKSERDKISIEHIYPQSDTEEWREAFSGVSEKNKKYYKASLGNLLLLSASINSSLQNDRFNDKKMPKFNKSGERIRNGYSDGSHSEIEVAREAYWKSEQIEARGLKLLSFMEERWGFKFKDDVDKKSLLFLDFEKTD
jgi:uncharacterized protein with ParB-like and HNH nuclease domain